MALVVVCVFHTKQQEGRSSRGAQRLYPPLVHIICKRFGDFQQRRMRLRNSSAFEGIAQKRHLHARPSFPLESCCSCPSRQPNTAGDRRGRSGTSPHRRVTGKVILTSCQCMKPSLTFPHVSCFGSQLCSTYISGTYRRYQQQWQQPCGWEQSHPKPL